MAGKTKTDTIPDLPTLMIEHWLNELLAINGHTAGAKVDQMFLGPGLFVVTLCRPLVIDGQATDIAKTIDIFDLIKSHQVGS